MKIKNIDGLSATDLQHEVNRGGKFVYFPFTVSLLLITFRRTSGVYLLRHGQNKTRKAILFSLISFFLGWWGIPFGPKFTWQSIRTNLRGGKDVTTEVMDTVAGYQLFREAELERKNNKPLHTM